MLLPSSENMPQVVWFLKNERLAVALNRAHSLEPAEISRTIADLRVRN